MVVTCISEVKSWFGDFPLSFWFLISGVPSRGEDTTNRSKAGFQSWNMLSSGEVTKHTFFHQLPCNCFRFQDMCIPLLGLNISSWIHLWSLEGPLRATSCFVWPVNFLWTDLKAGLSWAGPKFLAHGQNSKGTARFRITKLFGSWMQENASGYMSNARHRCWGLCC